MALRLAFVGTPGFAVPTLAELIAHGHEIACVYTQPARPAGRGQKSEPSPVARLALAHGLPLRAPESLKSTEVEADFAALGLDAAVVVAYGLLLPPSVLESPRLGCFNLHASLLPRWRGAAPIERAIMAGDVETGVVVMRLEEGLDTGPVLMVERVEIAGKTCGALREELAHLGADAMMRVLASLERGSVVEHRQTEEGATYARKIASEETRIVWTRSAREVDCLIRGLSPLPGAWCEARGERLKVLYARPVEGAGVPGRLLDDRLTVACGDGAIRLTRLQRAGRTAMDAEEMLRGFSLLRGEHL